MKELRTIKEFIKEQTDDDWIGIYNAGLMLLFDGDTILKIKRIVRKRKIENLLRISMNLESDKIYKYYPKFNKNN